MNTLFQGSYEPFKLPAPIKLGLTDLGYLHPTFVQNEVFLPIKKGLDLVVQSHTGSGKTTAFCLPILASIFTQIQKIPQVLILVPTRELAKQVATECSRLAHHTSIQVAVIYGGASLEVQMASLKAGASIIVGTPGRLKDLFQRGQLTLAQIETVVLDEADEMLSMGFWDDVTYLLAQTPTKRQTLLFSATLPPIIQQTLPKITRHPKNFNLSSDKVGAKSIRHVIHVENESQTKSRNLLYALEQHQPKRAIVFCNTKDETNVLENYLKRFSFKAKALNGDMSQSARERVLHDLKNHHLDILIATDVAARGIDIPALSHVFNYELPDNLEVYVHRTGRTGRIGNLGVAVSLIRGKDIMLIDNLKKSFDLDFETVPLPPESEVLRIQGDRLAVMLTEEADGVEISQYRQIAQVMSKRPDADEILAFLLRSHFKQTPSITHQQPTPQKPHYSKRRR